MKLHDAAILARELISRYCPDYTFRFDSSRRMFGRCYYYQKTIQLSRTLTLQNSEERVCRVILHEIAHALSPGAKHGPGWKSKCAEIGIPDETRCWTEEDTVPVPKKYLAQCPTCGTMLGMNRVQRGTKQYFHRSCNTPVQLYPNIEYILLMTGRK